MAMVIGTNSRNTIFEVFRTGVHEVVRKMGLPVEISLAADHTRWSRSPPISAVEYFRKISP